MNSQLSALYFNGITPDTLGGYLSGVGLLSACSQWKHPLRGCWRDGMFVLLSASSFQQDEIELFLFNDWRYPEYPVEPSTVKKKTPKVLWSDVQKEDTKKKESSELRRFRSGCSLREAIFLDSHIVPAQRNIFNPLFGTGGNVGKRSFIKVMKEASALTEKPDSEVWLKSTLYGEQTFLPKLQSTGTWFVYANKTFNSGQDGFYREGRLSPWSFLLALEGALLLRGGVNRRLSTTARPYVAFPFIAEAANPLDESGVGLKRAGEFWAPIWSQPATLAEITTLFKRGLMRLGNKAATAPHEYGAAALGAGADAGITEFVPFELRETTSGQVFEAIPHAPIQIRENDRKSHRAAELITALIPWIARLPFEPKDSKQKGKYSGLRGPIEQAIIAISEEPSTQEHWRQLLLKLAGVQARIDQDRTRGWRTKCIPLPRLSAAWLNYLWDVHRPDEIEVACAISSIGAESDAPLLTNIFGVKLDVKLKRDPIFPKERPASAIWNDGDPVSVLGNILYRRLVDSERKGKTDTPWPLRGSYPLSPEIFGRFLDGALNYNEIARWIPCLSLLNWKKPPVPGEQNDRVIRDGLLTLDGLLRPLLTSDIRWEKNRRPVTPDTVSALRLIALLRQGNLENAVEFACSRYRALHVTPIQPYASACSPGEIERLIAGLLIPLSDREILKGRKRWLLDA